MKTIETMCREVGGVPSAAGGVRTVPPKSPPLKVRSESRGTGTGVAQGRPARSDAHVRRTGYKPSPTLLDAARTHTERIRRAASQPGSPRNRGRPIRLRSLRRKVRVCDLISHSPPEFGAEIESSSSVVGQVFNLSGML